MLSEILPAADLVRNYLAKDRGPLRVAATETDTEPSKRIRITFADKTVFSCKLHNEIDAERTYLIIVDYIQKFGYREHRPFCEMSYGGFHKTQSDLKRDLGLAESKFEPEPTMLSEAEKTVAAANKITISQLRQAIRKFKVAAKETSHRENTPRGKVKPCVADDLKAQLSVVRDLGLGEDTKTLLDAARIDPAAMIEASRKIVNRKPRLSIKDIPETELNNQDVINESKRIVSRTRWVRVGQLSEEEALALRRAKLVVSYDRDRRIKASPAIP